MQLLACVTPQIRYRCWIVDIGSQLRKIGCCFSYFELTLPASSFRQLLPISSVLACAHSPSSSRCLTLMADTRSQRFHSRNYPYEIVEQYLDVEPQTLPPSNFYQHLRRRKVSLLFGGLLLLTLSVALWRNFHFSLPLPDFPFKMTDSRAPSCALQQLLDAARLLVFSDTRCNAAPSFLIPPPALTALPTTMVVAA